MIDKCKNVEYFDFGDDFSQDAVAEFISMAVHFGDLGKLIIINGLKVTEPLKKNQKRGIIAEK